MRKIKYGIIVIFTCFVCMALFFGCDSMPNANNFGEKPMTDYYKIKDFESIIIGESTYQDVYKVASMESIQITSYGGFCEYPMEDGNKILIKFCGPELIVDSIEVIKT